jgi:uncharacterized protein YcaQ
MFVYTGYLMNSPIKITAVHIRRLAIRAQRLETQPALNDKTQMLALIRQLGCLQIDPLNVVARSPLLVLWSRLGDYEVADLETLMWEDRQLFEHWAHAASIVLVEDFPLFQMQMRKFGRGNGSWAQRVRKWMELNEPFRQYILEELDGRGPLYAQELEDRTVQSWQSSGWTNSRNVSMMLGFMWEQGDITVTRRVGAGFGLKKQWGLLEQHMPQWSDHKPLSQREVVRDAAQKSLKALGAATEKQIQNHFIRGGYPELADVLAELVDGGQIHRIVVDGEDPLLAADWIIHADTLHDLEQIQNGEWQERTTLLSPFDNLIADRERTEMLFDFHYRSEIYTPKAKRKYGYYVLPILDGDRLIGRIDPKMDRKTRILHVHAIHREDEAPDSGRVARRIAGVIKELGRFLGAEQIRYGDVVPAGWEKEFEDCTL